MDKRNAINTVLQAYKFANEVHLYTLRMTTDLLKETTDQDHQERLEEQVLVIFRTMGEMHKDTIDIVRRIHNEM